MQQLQTFYRVPRCRRTPLLESSLAQKKPRANLHLGEGRNIVAEVMDRANLSFQDCNHPSDGVVFFDFRPCLLILSNKITPRKFLNMKFEVLIRSATVVMTDLERELGETIGLGIIKLGHPSPQLQVLSSVTGTSNFCFSLKTGLYIALHTSAPGKAILAYMPESLRETILKQLDFEVYTENTIKSIEDFRKELQLVLKNGYAVDRGERLRDCNCVGVPLLLNDGGDLASIWVTGLSSAISEKKFEKIAGHLKVAANKTMTQMRMKSSARNELYVNDLIHKTIQRLEISLSESLDFKKMAQDFFVSYSWFRQAFKQKTGLSPQHYFLNLKLVSAKKQLVESDAPIKDIMLNLGYDDPSYFSAYFKGKEGLSPQAYRNHYAKSLRTSPKNEV